VQLLFDESGCYLAANGGAAQLYVRLLEIIADETPFGG